MLADIGFIGGGSGDGGGKGGGGGKGRGGRGWADDKAAPWNRYAASPAVVSRPGQGRAHFPHVCLL